MTTFLNVPSTARASKNFIELAGVKRSLADLFIPPTGGLIGQYDPAETATVDYEPVKVLSADDVGSKFGFGSHIHRMALRIPAAAYLQGGGIYAFPLPEEVGGTAANDTITFTNNATSNGTLYFLIAGDLVEVAVTNGDTPTEIGDALVAAITAKQNLPITAANVIGVVTNTAKFKGTAGNQIKVVINPGGDTQEAANPSGTTVALGNADGFLSSGATDPSVEDVFFSSGADNLGDRWYTVFNMPLTDQTNINFHKASGAARSDPSVNRMFASYGAYIKETYAQALALPANTNSEWVGEIWENRSWSPAFELSAALMGNILVEQNQAPNRPYKTLATDIQVDTTISDLNYTSLDALFRAGMSYCKIDTTGISRFGDIALTRRTNDLGGETSEWHDGVSIHTRQAKAYSLEQLFLSEKYQRAVVVTNDDVTNVDYAIAPKDVIADITKLIQDLWLPNAWTKNAENVIESITAEINSVYESRIDSELTDDEAKPLRIIALRYAYLLN